EWAVDGKLNQGRLLRDSCLHSSQGYRLGTLVKTGGAAIHLLFQLLALIFYRLDLLNPLCSLKLLRTAQNQLGQLRVQVVQLFENLVVLRCKALSQGAKVV